MKSLTDHKTVKKSLSKVISQTITCQDITLKTAQENTTKLFSDETTNECLQNLVKSLNELLLYQVAEKDVQNKRKSSSPDPSTFIIVEKLLKVLANLPLQDYIRQFKTLVLLCVLPILFVLGNLFDIDNDQQVFKCITLVSTILFKCGQNSQGDSSLFAIKWEQFFSWMLTNSIKMSEKTQNNLCILILQNIYISQKSVTEFDVEFSKLCESIEMSNANIGLTTLQFLIQQELDGHGAKTKLSSHLVNHIRILTTSVVRCLEKTISEKSVGGKRKKSISIPNNNFDIEGNIFRSCWLSRLALEALITFAANKPSNISSSEILTESATMSDNDISTMLQLIVSQRLEHTLSFLSGTYQSKEIDNGKLTTAKYFAFKFLHSILKTKSKGQEKFLEIRKQLPKANFLVELWSVCLKHEMSGSSNNNLTGEMMMRETVNDESCTANKSLSDVLIPKFLLKDIYEAVNNDEFEQICRSIIGEMKSRKKSGTDEATMSSIVPSSMLHELVDAELTDEKWKMRVNVISEYLHMSLLHMSNWTNSVECLDESVIPYIKFQMKLLQRRSPMGTLSSLAICFESITCIPFKEIEDVTLFRKVFCNAADLLNAFTVHRLDVISFRTHIYLQCFQFLIENLAMKADQKNKLTDGEIFEMRHCAHNIERLCNSAKLGQKEFSRISPYFVAILIRQFEKFTVYPAVKNPLLNGIYKLLDLCDEHGIAQLNTMLTVGSREIFKTVYELYKKFYQYKGKV